MASILDLPPELLDNVSIHLLPNSLVPFVLSCKAIYLSSAPIIAQHNAYVASWRHVSHDVLYVLHEIARDPVIAGYVESLRLRDMRRDIVPNSNFLAPAGSKEAMEKITEMVLANPFLQETGTDSEDWWESNLRAENSCKGFGFEHPIATLIALLLFLPNLKELGLPSWWSRMGGFGEEAGISDVPPMLLSRLIALARNPASSKIDPKPEGRPLASLETLTPYSSAGCTRTVFQDVELFMALPKLQNVYSVSGVATSRVTMDLPFSVGVPGGYYSKPFRWQKIHLGGVPLRRLEIAYGCCNTGGIGAILSNTPHLEVFKYSHQNKWHGSEIAWNGGAFVAAVENWVGNTLRELVINMETIHADYSGSLPHCTATERLETLEVDVSVLLGDTETLLSEHCLQYLLPGSIKTLIMNLEKPDLGLVAMLVDGFKDLREILFPGLETVVMRVRGCDKGNEKEFEDVRQVVEDEGIEWEVLGEELFGVTSWKGQFCERFDVTA